MNKALIDKVVNQSSRSSRTFKNQYAMIIAEVKRQHARAD